MNEDFSARVWQIPKDLWDHSVGIRKQAGKYRLQYDSLIVVNVRKTIVQAPHATVSRRTQ